MADIYHWRRHPAVRDGQRAGHPMLRAMVGGVTAIVLLAALMAGLAGSALYAAFLLVTRLFG